MAVTYTIILNKNDRVVYSATLRNKTKLTRACQVQDFSDGRIIVRYGNSGKNEATFKNYREFLSALRAMTEHQLLTFVEDL